MTEQRDYIMKIFQKQVKMEIDCERILFFEFYLLDFNFPAKATWGKG